MARHVHFTTYRATSGGFVLTLSLWFAIRALAFSLFMLFTPGYSHQRITPQASALLGAFALSGAITLGLLAAFLPPVGLIACAVSATVLAGLGIAHLTLLGIQIHRNQKESMSLVNDDTTRRLPPPAAMAGETNPPNTISCSPPTANDDPNANGDEPEANTRSKCSA